MAKNRLCDKRLLRRLCSAPKASSKIAAVCRDDCGIDDEPLGFHYYGDLSLMLLSFRDISTNFENFFTQELSCEAKVQHLLTA